MCVKGDCISMYTSLQCSQRLEETVGSPGTEIRGSYKTLNVGAESHTRVLWKSSKHTLKL